MSTLTATSATPASATTGTASPAAGGVAASSAQEASDRFLKLLVAQMKNQDPLNPLDNAQVTSQMAQINTVTGIEKLNTTVQSLSSQFGQLRALQGAQLVGHAALVEGNGLSLAEGQAAAGFELAGAADNVRVEILGPHGKVVDTLDLGALSAGRQAFDWSRPEKLAESLPDGSAMSFRVVATAGAKAVAATPLTAQRILAVATEGDRLMLELANGQRISHDRVKALS